jgi:GNAT superfamily N-acetyltransferase
VPTESLQRITLDRSAIEAAVLLSDEAGWNQTADDWAVFVTRGTVFGAVSEGRLVATAAALPYGLDFGWIAMVLVTAPFRRRGIATSLVADCVAVLLQSGRKALLDASSGGAPVYGALGFTALGGLTRWAGEGRGEALPSDRIPFALDRAAFGADRRFLLEDFLARPGSLACAVADGFAVLRPGRRAWHAGPVVGSPSAAEDLLERMIRAAPGPLVVDLLDAGSRLAPLLASRGFRVQRRFHRMALGCTSLPGDPALALAAAGPEFG